MRWWDRGGGLLLEEALVEGLAGPDRDCGREDDAIA